MSGSPVGLTRQVRSPANPDKAANKRDTYAFVKQERKRADYCGRGCWFQNDLVEGHVHKK
jgi:hypothetical protein